MKTDPKKHLQGKIFLFLTLIVLLGSVAMSGQAQEAVLEKNHYRLVQIMVPGTDFDDDGTCFSRFPGYTLYNEEGEDIIQLPACLHSPFIIRMLPGGYKLETMIEGKKIRASFAVVPGEYFQQFSFPDLGWGRETLGMDE